MGTSRPSLDIRLLGSPEVEVAGRDLVVDTRKAVALLAYLAVEGRVTRDTLASLFWAESSTDKARASLRRTLSALRSGLGPDHVIADRDSVRLDYVDSCDVVSFQADLEATVHHDHPAAEVCPDCIPLLVGATDRYRSDFLQGFFVRGAPDFEDWARNVAEGLRMKAGDAFHRLATAFAAAGDYGGAISAVARWVDLDPLHEPAYRQLMLLNAWTGDRPGAIEAYNQCVGVLDRELGVAPLEETTELYEAILDDDLPPAPAIRQKIKTAAPKKRAPTGALLDRVGELATLRRAWASSQVSGAVLYLHGASWMGKTRLLEEFVGRASSDGSRTVLSRAFRVEQTIPFGVAAQILTQVRPLIDRVGEQVPQWVRQELSRLDPALDPGGQATTGDAFGELRLFEAFNGMIRLLTKDDPLLLVLDDAQWADPASASLLAYLGHRIEEVPVLLVFSLRSGEEVPDALADLIDEGLPGILLSPLTAEALGDRLTDASEAEAVVSRTGGVPLLVLEELAGTLSDGEAPGVTRYVEDRLRGLGELGRQVLASASILGGVCDAQLLREVSGRGDDEIVEAVEELIASGLLREIPEGLTFGLDTLARAVYESTSLTRRRLLHSRAATALGSRPRARTDARMAAAVASQHREAGSSEAAWWYRLAGSLSRAMNANAEAIDFYETAIALGDSDVGFLHLELGELALAAGDYSKALQELRTAAAESDGQRLAIVEHRLGETQRLLGRFALAEEHFERSAPTHPHPAAVHADWALLHYRLGDQAKAETAANRALELADEEGDDRGIARALNILGVVTTDHSEAMRHLDRALELIQDDEIARMASLNNKARLLGLAGQIDEAVALVGEAIDIAARSGHRHREAALRNQLADLHHQAGRDEAAQQALTEAVKLFAGVDAGTTWEPEVWLLSAW
ncbi:MAG: tetratricopeptide repeat protein [Acidimicrobiia bacterium]